MNGIEKIKLIPFPPFFHYNVFAAPVWSVPTRRLVIYLAGLQPFSFYQASTGIRWAVPELGVRCCWVESLFSEPDHNRSQALNASWLPVASDDRLHVWTNTSNTLSWMSIKVDSSLGDGRSAANEQHLAWPGKYCYEPHIHTRCPVIQFEHSPPVVTRLL